MRLPGVQHFFNFNFYMRVYYEKIVQQGISANISFYTALEGFSHMGFHTIEVGAVNEIPITDLDSVAVGSIQFIHEVLHHLGKTYLTDLDYPESLRPFLGRKLWASTINEFDTDNTKWNVFIKPRGLSKKFTGRVVKNLSDLRGTADQEFNVPIWLSEIVEFVREWRVYVRYGRILDIRPYKGKWQAQYDSTIIEKIITSFTDAPNGYALDVGVTTDGRTVLVEVNDGYSIGAYGLFFVDYAKLLSARWAQLTGTTDLCAFDL